MTQKDLWTPISETFGAIATHVGPALQQAIADAGLNEVKGWQHLLLATSIAPQPISVERVRVRGVYNAPRIAEEALNGLVSGGYLTADFVATAKAREAIEIILAGQRKGLVELALLPGDEPQQLVELVGRVCDAAAALAAPPTPCLADQRRRPAAADLPLTERFVRYAGQLNAFRDDCHIAAWKPQGTDGHTWEIFSYIWRSEATSHDDMPEQLMQFRGYSPEESTAAVQTLVERGWIETADEPGKYRASQSGNKLRQEVEDLTDSYFYTAFNVLNEDEQNTMHDLATRAGQHLQPVQQ